MSQNLWRIHLLGRLHVQWEQEEAQSATASLSMGHMGALLGYLVLRTPHPVPREELMGVLWPEEPLPTAQNRLRVLLSALRRRIDPTILASGSILIAERSTVRLVADFFSSDYHDFLRALQMARDAVTPRDIICHLEAATALYQGEFLPGYYEDWILTERRRLAALHFQALRTLSQRCLQIRAPEGALEYALQAVALEALDEEAHGDLIRIYAHLGQHSTALRHYEQFTLKLWQQVEVQPSEKLRSLAAHIRTELEHGLAQGKQAIYPFVRPDADAMQSLYANGKFPQPFAQLPIYLPRFFGREEERARLQALLEPASSTRLINLLGLGGVGKTRLAIETAETLQSAYGGRVYFTPLAHTLDPAHIGIALAHSLSLPPCSGLDPLSQAAAVLHQAPSLLILDNLEHLLPHAGASIARLLSEAPSLHCLLTSRLTAGIEGEQEFPLGPLPTMVEGYCSTAESSRQLPNSPSVALFVDRVQAVRADFQLTNHNAEAVAQLCCALEGLPLALELAAARARVMTPSEMNQQAGGLLDWLVDVRGSKNARHRSLRVTLEDSYHLLSDKEQCFFRALTVFVGGFDARAAGYIGMDIGASAAETLQLLECLRAASLLHVVETPEATTRFAMLETLREFGRERLAEEQEDISTRRKHLEYFAHSFWAQDIPPILWSMRETLRVSGEDGNLRAAMEFGLSANADMEAQQWTLTLARKLSGYWEKQGRWSEGRAYLERAARLPYTQTNNPAHISVLRGAGMLSCLLGEYEAAKAFTVEGMRKAQILDYPLGIAGCRKLQGSIAFQLDDYPAAHAYFEQALEIYKELQNAPHAAYCLLHLGNVAFYLGEDSRAQERFQEALSAYRQLGDRPGIAAALLRLGNVLRQQGDYSTAGECLLEALTCFQEMGHRQGAASSLGALGMLARFQNQSDVAQQHYMDALVIFQEIGSQRSVAACTLQLGEVEHLRGKQDQAKLYYQEAMILCHKIGDRRNLAACLCSQGQLALEQDKLNNARVHFEEALHIEQEIHSRGGIANCLAGLGMAALSQDNLQEARTRLGAALQIYDAMGSLPCVLTMLQNFAQLAIQLGEPIRAARLMGGASVLHKKNGDLPPAVDTRRKTVVAALHATLDAAIFAAAWQEGERLSMSEAVAYALQNNAHIP